MSRLAALLLAVVAAVALAGCGTEDYRTHAETEGLYVDVGPLTYQVQISRYLNPHDVEDNSYFIGLPPGTKEVGKGEVWFGVFLRVVNYTEETQTAADQFKMIDSEEKIYEPVPLDARINPFAWHPAEIAAGGVFPKVSSVAGSGPTEGGLILFRVGSESLQNRPLELHITKPGVGEATIGIDL